MKKPLLVGALAGILITAGVALFVQQKGLISGGGGVVTSNGSAPRDPENAPLVTTLSRFHANFAGHEDLITRRAIVLSPQVTVQAWEKAMSESGLPVNQRTSSGCRSAELSRAITIRPEQTRSILSGQTNVLFIPNDIVRCFSTQSKVILAVDNLLNAKTIYELPAVVNIERLVEVPLAEVRPEVLNAMRVTRDDVPYLAFGNRGMVNLSLNLTIIHFTLLPEKPILEPRKVPPFLAGAEGIRPAALQNYLRGLETQSAPVMVDVRDQRLRSAGVFPGAIPAPFIAADERQLRFLIDMPMTLVAGARFETSKLPDNMMTPLVLFGNDEQDASVVWMARNLRLMGYHRVFFVIGGLEALKRDAPNFRI